ncbi:MAG: ATP-binding cassette domain-containing protein, partial [bacterium]|nr:ATP-binding cassette domain-containing protein [bacterium]
MEHIRRSYPANGASQSERIILRDVNMAIAPGEVVALTGRSGAGKTSLLHIAAGLGRPSAGRVLFEGQDLGGLTPRELSRLRQRRIGLVFQNNLSLSALPVWENAALPLLLQGQPQRKARRAAETMLERVGLAAFARCATATLSGGQRRRLGLARALAGQPRLLLADEPTADLDEITAAEIEKLLFDWLADGNRTAL